MRLTLPVAPCPRPRMTRRDQWAKRPSVVRYRAFRDRIMVALGKDRKRVPKHGIHVTFRVPMPKSWPKYRKADMEGQPHQQKPDVDNYLKGLLDAIWPDEDCDVWDVRATKVWAREGSIEIAEIEALESEAA